MAKGSKTRQAGAPPWSPEQRHEGDVGGALPLLSFSNLEKMCVVFLVVGCLVFGGCLVVLLVGELHSHHIACSGQFVPWKGCWGELQRELSHEMRWDFRYIFKIAIYTLASKDSLFSPTFSSSTSAAIAPKESQLIEKVLWTGNWQLQELSPLIWFLLGKQQAPRVFLSEIKKLRLL